MSMLPPKKRQQQQAQQQDKDVSPVPAEAPKKPDEPSEEGDKATTANSGQAASSFADDVETPSIAAVETSKIRGTAAPRKPRVGEQYQAELPQLVEQPHKR